MVLDIGIHETREGRMGSIFRFYPVTASALLIGPVHLFGYNAFEAQQTSLPEQIRSDVARLKGRRMNAFHPPAQQALKIGFAHGKRQAGKPPSARFQEAIDQVDVKILPGKARQQLAREGHFLLFFSPRFWVPGVAGTLVEDLQHGVTEILA